MDGLTAMRRDLPLSCRPHRRLKLAQLGGQRSFAEAGASSEDAPLPAIPGITIVPQVRFVSGLRVITSRIVFSIWLAVDRAALSAIAKHIRSARHSATLLRRPRAGG